MISIDLERVGDNTDSAHISVNPGEVVKFTLLYHVDGTPTEALDAMSDAELIAELKRRLEAR